MGPSGVNGTIGANEANLKVPQNVTSANLQDSFNSFKQFVISNLVNSTRESDLTGFIHKIEKNTLFAVL